MPAHSLPPAIYLGPTSSKLTYAPLGGWGGYGGALQATKACFSNKLNKLEKLRFSECFGTSMSADVNQNL